MCRRSLGVSASAWQPRKHALGCRQSRRCDADSDSAVGVALSAPLSLSCAVVLRPLRACGHLRTRAAAILAGACAGAGAPQQRCFAELALDTCGCKRASYTRCSPNIPRVLSRSLSGASGSRHAWRAAHCSPQARPPQGPAAALRTRGRARGVAVVMLQHVRTYFKKTGKGKVLKARRGGCTGAAALHAHARKLPRWRRYRLLARATCAAPRSPAWPRRSSTRCSGADAVTRAVCRARRLLSRSISATTCIAARPSRRLNTAVRAAPHATQPARAATDASRCSAQAPTWRRASSAPRRTRTWSSTPTWRCTRRAAAGARSSSTQASARA